ncbi:MAG: ADP-glyceromanno-heptose 6-epimerase [Betaproteobacteria bacterium]|nr:ADP-glyceromanno-heptose 6-epimerase [Betaproteobacteria bacterium]
MYIVTGGAGFIGSAAIWRLNQAGIDDIVIVDDLGSSDKWKNIRNLSYADYVQYEAFLRMAEEDALPWPLTAVVHMGACSNTTERNAEFLIRNNFKYSQTLCRLTLERNARFINASSAATYGDGSQGFSDRLDKLRSLTPLNMYGYSKQLFDLWLLREGLLGQVVSLKFFNVYGPNEYHKGSMRSVVCKAWHEINTHNSLRLFRSSHPDYPDGGQLRDFIYVKDCAEIILWFLSQNAGGGIYNVGTGVARSWNDLAHAVFLAMERETHIEYVDMPAELRGNYQNFTQADMAWLQRLNCPVRMHNLEDGVRDYVCRYLAAANAYLAS